MAATAGRGPIIAFHGVWFGVWLLVNAGVIPGLPVFDPFPFQFLTLAVSLEAIFLALFVLASQNRLAEQADKRSLAGRHGREAGGFGAIRALSAGRRDRSPAVAGRNAGRVSPRPA